MRKILRKVDINSLYICPAYLYIVPTLPREIQTSHFSAVLLIQTSDYYVISEETNCNCCTAAYLFTYCCSLFSIICVDHDVILRTVATSTDFFDPRQCIEYNTITKAYDDVQVVTFRVILL